MHMLQCLSRVKGWTNPSLRYTVCKWFKILFLLKLAKMYHRLEYHMYVCMCMYTHIQMFKKKIKNLTIMFSELPQAALY